MQHLQPAAVNAAVKAALEKQAIEFQVSQNLHGIPGGEPTTEPPAATVAL